MTTLRAKRHGKARSDNRGDAALDDMERPNYRCSGIILGHQPATSSTSTSAFLATEQEKARMQLPARFQAHPRAITFEAMFCALQHGHVLPQTVKQQLAASGAAAEVVGSLLVHGAPIPLQVPPMLLVALKEGKPVDGVLPLKLHQRQPLHLLGRSRPAVDYPLDHPSCSSIHAALFLALSTLDSKPQVVAETDVKKEAEPPLLSAKKALAAIAAQRIVLEWYLVDLGSTNGTVLNGKKMVPGQPEPLLDGDVVTFAESTRQYVLLER